MKTEAGRDSLKLAFLQCNSIFNVDVFHFARILGVAYGRLETPPLSIHYRYQSFFYVNNHDIHCPRFDNG